MAVTLEYGSKLEQNVETGEWSASARYVCDSLAEAKASVPLTYEGLALLSKSIGQWRGTSKYAADCRYGGIEQEGPDGEDDGSFEILPEEREVPIENFPDRDYLISEYGAFEDGGVLKFPMRLPKKTDSRTGLRPSKAAGPWSLGGENNPLFNVRTYPEIYEVAVRTFFRKTFPSRLLQEAGTIITRLPSGFGNQGGTERQWWVERPHRVRVGNGWRITWRARSLEGLPALAGVIQAKQEVEGK